MYKGVIVNINANMACTFRDSSKEHKVTSFQIIAFYRASQSIQLSSGPRNVNVCSSKAKVDKAATVKTIRIVTAGTVRRPA